MRSYNLRREWYVSLAGLVFTILFLLSLSFSTIFFTLSAPPPAVGDPAHIAEVRDWIQCIETHRQSQRKKYLPQSLLVGTHNDVELSHDTKKQAIHNIKSVLHEFHHLTYFGVSGINGRGVKKAMRFIREMALTEYVHKTPTWLVVCRSFYLSLFFSFSIDLDLFSLVLLFQTLSPSSVYIIICISHQQDQELPFGVKLGPRVLNLARRSRGGRAKMRAKPVYPPGAVLTLDFLDETEEEENPPQTDEGDEAALAKVLESSLFPSA